MITKIYLSGPMAGCNDYEMYGWRNELKEKYNWVDYPSVKFIDPTRRNFRGVKMTRQIEKEIVELDKIDVCQSDAVLVRLNPEKASVGTHQEVIYGWERGKLVVIVIPNDPAFRLSPWLSYHSHSIVYDLDHAMHVILDDDYGVKHEAKE
jgi:nucleoside 2-deoxyribosyltransferase